MATDHWIAANIAGVGDCFFRTHALSDIPAGSGVPGVFLARKLTILAPARNAKGETGLALKKIGDRHVNGAQVILWAEATANDRAQLATVWPDEIAVAGRPPLSLVGKE